MKNIIKLTVGICAVALVFGVFSTFISDSIFPDVAFSPEKVLAWGSTCGSCDNGGGNTPGDAPDDGDNDPNPVAPTCDVSASVEQVEAGDEYVISWNGTPANGQFTLGGTPVGANGSYTFVWDADNVFLTFTFEGHSAGGSCIDTVTVYRKVDAPTCDISANITTVEAGDQFTVSWNGTPAHSTLFKVNGTIVAANDSATYTFPADRTRPITFTLTGSNASGQCSDEVVINRTADEVPGCTDPSATNYNPNATEDDGSCVYPPSVPKCDVFNIAQSQVVPGSIIDLIWETTNADSVSINRGVGTVPVDGTKTVTAPNTDGTYTYILTATKGSESVTCSDSIVVKTHVTTSPAIDIIKRDAFDKDDVQTVSIDGTANFEIVVTNTGTEDLVNVTVTDPLESNCNKTIGNLAIGASHTYTCSTSNVQNDFTNVANVTGNSAVDNAVVNDTDPTDVNVQSIEVFTCENNVTFTANPASLPYGGGNSTLSWNVTGADTVSISSIGSVSPSGNKVVTVSNDVTYTLTATKSGFSAINCTVSIDVAERTGGGGGSRKPRCELAVSDDTITAGQEITLTWDTSRARKVILKDNHGETLLETEDSDTFDGSMKVKPTEDTTYILIAKRGVRERTCEVDVKITDDITVLETRTQDPRVAGIALTEVPYTGFEAGPALTLIFYIILTVWGLFVAYVFVIRRNATNEVSFAGSDDSAIFTNVNTVVNETEVSENKTDTATASTTPTDLPVAKPVIGYAATMTEEETDEAIEMTELENRAHAQKVLLSSDAMRFFMNATKPEERIEKLDAVIKEAKASFPSEDGWVVLNLARIESLSLNDDAHAQVKEQTAPITGGSLAEAIVKGDIVLAYKMIENRPLIALADAAADLDAVYRLRKGEKVSVSDMLVKETEGLTNAQIEEAIEALTSALDGTYTSEAEAVKMAILKAVKAIA